MKSIIVALGPIYLAIWAATVFGAHMPWFFFPAVLGVAAVMFAWIWFALEWMDR